MQVRSSIAVLLAAFAILSSSHAATVIDQSTGDSPELGNGGAAFAHTSFQPFQTFTAGISGKLTSVDVGLSYFNAGGSTNNLEGMLSILKGSQILGAQSFTSEGLESNDSFPKFKNVSFQNIHLIANETYAIKLTAPTLTFPVNMLIWERSPNDVYAGGTEHFGQGRDFAFRTHMEVSAVPEPSTTMLFAVSLIGYITLRRKYYSTEASDSGATVSHTSTRREAAA